MTTVKTVNAPKPFAHPTLALWLGVVAALALAASPAGAPFATLILVAAIVYQLVH